MKTNIGLWIDHRRAVIAVVSGGEEEIKEILSGADWQPGRINGERSADTYESLQVSADDVKDRRFEQHLNIYYDEVIACVHDAESLLILGPGEAKGQFRKRLEQEKPGKRIVKVETADKMTDRQIAARIRDHFTPASPVIAL